MAPEQARGGAVDARADIYALGCVLYRALTGSVLFERESDLEKLWAHVHDPPPNVLSVCPDLPERLAIALDRALAKDPRDRQPSAAELGQEIASALGPAARP
jgi:serine/threonine-protein kinase